MPESDTHLHPNGMAIHNGTLAALRKHKGILLRSRFPAGWKPSCRVLALAKHTATQLTARRSCSSGAEHQFSMLLLPSRMQDAPRKQACGGDITGAIWSLDPEPCTVTYVEASCCQ